MLPNWASSGISRRTHVSFLSCATLSPFLNVRVSNSWWKRKVRMRHRPLPYLLWIFLLTPAVSFAQQDATKKPRARDLGVPFDGTPGPLNAITDVSGVLVGDTTLISGEGKLVVGKGPVRTGVT